MSDAVPPARHHDHGHPHSSAHDLSGHDHKLNANGSLLQVAAIWRLAGAICLLIPLWIAVYGLVT